MGLIASPCSKETTTMDDNCAIEKRMETMVALVLPLEKRAIQENSLFQCCFCDNKEGPPTRDRTNQIKSPRCFEQTDNNEKLECHRLGARSFRI
ncbi:hypothetical protein KIN20_020414 [Parelaphostrongylus tenuis]|uniref:Uncharacterized protein n=1 Tax=Parelaphostrongylus tenuis TaxID=148309 RepID=A0AAD5MMF4_PARTN|nr:hypothetical protein KIN20_020414 [Parelaphostrongylus tenuis]